MIGHGKRQGTWKRFFAPGGSSGRFFEDLPESSTLTSPFHHLATKLDFELTNGKVGHSVLVTSPRTPQSGGRTSLELGHSLAENLRHRVLLIDGTLGASGIGSVLGTRGEPGFTDLLLGSLDRLDSLIRPTPHERLFLLPAGMTMSLPAVRLWAGNLAPLAQRLQEHFDYLVFHGAPVLEDPRVLLIPALVDRVLLVAEEGVTRMEDLEAGRRNLEERGARISLLLVRPGRGWRHASNHGLR